MRRTPSMVAEPNVLPLIDVLLVLLVISMLTAVPSVRRWLDLQLPTTGEAGDGVPMVLSVTRGPAYELNGRRLDASRLEEELRMVYAPRTERILFVKGERSLRYAELMHVFDAARGAGVRATAVITKTLERVDRADPPSEVR